MDGSASPTADPRPPGLRQVLGPQRALLLLTLLAQSALALALARGWVAVGNSLATSGHWVATKATLARGVMGANHFLRGGQSVAGRRLNLGAWHGFQEVLYREPLRPSEIEFEFELFAKAHLSLIFSKTGDGFSGVRLSLDPARESMVFEASALGEFTKRAPLDAPALKARTVHRLRVGIEEGAIEVALDGSPLGRYPVRVREPAQVGFRGGGRTAIVDNIAIRERGSGSPLAPSATVYETFGASAGTQEVGAAFAIVLLGNVIAFLPARRGPEGKARHRLLGLIVGNATLAAMAVLLVAFLAWRAERYPAADAAVRAGENAWKLSEAGEIRAAIRRRYAAPPPAGTQRVLLIGSSQTWGSGAARESETIAAVLEQRLDARAPGARHEVVNGGISGVDSTFLLSVFEQDWARLGARVVVVNLSNNDGNAAALGQNLRRLVRLARDSGAEPLFVLEPNSPEDRRAELDKLAVKHEAMREVGREASVAVVDMHGYLLENQDRGFLFWDFAHLSSLGQRLFAERVLPEVKRALDEARR